VGEQTNRISADRRVHLALVAVLIAVGAWWWRGCLDDFFVQDDFVHLEGASRLVGSWGALARGVFDLGWVDNDYTPVSTTLYYTLMQRAFGVDPFPYHLVNLMLHVGSAVALYALAFHLLGNAWIAFAVALFFVTRSLAYVTVFWTATVQDLIGCLMTLLFLLAVRAYVAESEPSSDTETTPPRQRLGESGASGGAGAGRRFLWSGVWRRMVWGRAASAERWLVCACTAYVVGVFAKESVLVIIGFIPFVWLVIRVPKDRAEWWRMVAVCAVFLGIGLGCFGFHEYMTWGMGTAAPLGGFHGQRVGYFVYWTLYGDWAGTFREDGAFESSPASFIAFGAYLAVLVAATLVARRDGAGPRRYVPWLFFGMTLLASFPMVVLRDVDRLTQYYAYVPSVFVALSLAACVRLVLDRGRAVAAATAVVVVAGLLGSAYVEARLLADKDALPFVQRTLTDPQGREVVRFEENPRFRWTGGWMHPGLRHLSRNIHDDFQDWVRRARPMGLERDAVIVLVGRERLLCVTSRLRSEGYELRKVSVLESMLRVFFRAPDLELRIVVPDTEVFDELQIAAYCVRVGELEAFLARHRDRAYLFLVQRADGHLVQGVELKRAPVNEVVPVVRLFLGG
jgi:hypothetical protein